MSSASSSSSSSSSSVSSRASSPEATKPKELKRKRTRKTKDVESDDSDSDSSEDEREANDETLPESDEPALSHKERRKRKKEAKLAAKLAEEGKPPKKRKLKDGTAKEVTSTARKNSVWVGNMSFKTDQDDLRRFFKDVGEITRINLPTKAPTGPGVKPQNRGFAYVDFATPESKAAAIALSEQPLLGRKLLIKDGDDFTGRPAAIAGEAQFSDPTLAHKTHSKTAQKILRAQKQPPAPTLFFGNLGFDTTDDSLRQLLDAHRPPQPKQKVEEGTNDEEKEKGAKAKQDNWIRKIRLGTFEDSGVCKGFGFVDFTSIEHATAALINPRNHQLNGRKLIVEYAGADAVRRGAPKSAKSSDRPRLDRFKSYNTSGDNNFKSRRSQYAPQESRQDTDSNVESGLVEQEEKPTWSQKEQSLKSDGQGGVRHKGPKHRPKPGAALALAKRESAVIIPSQGKKITF